MPCDHRGTGGARHRAPAITFEPLVADLFRVLDALKIDACVPEADCDAERAWGRLIVKRSDARAAVQMLECIEGIALQSRLASITLPTLVLHDSRDVIESLAPSEKLAELTPRAKLVVAAGSGHVPTITRPRWVAEQIDEFFDVS